MFMNNKKEKVLLLLFSFFLSFLILELYARVSVKAPPYLWQMDMKLGYKPASNVAGKYYGFQVKTNSKGLRDYEYSYLKKDGIFRVVVLGDSFTYGLGIKNLDDIYAKISERELKKRSYNVEIINMGVGGFNTHQEVEWFKMEGAKYNPELVILGFTANDNEPVLVDINTSIWLKERGLLGFKELLRRHIYLSTYFIESFRKLKAAYNFTGRNNKLSNPRDYDVCIEKIKEFDLYLKSCNIKLIVFLLPKLDDFKDHKYIEIYNYVQTRLKMNDVACCDLFPYLKDYKEKELWVTPKDYHPNELCNRIFANVLTAKLAEHIDKGKNKLF